MVTIPGSDYDRYKTVFRGCRFPLAFVDLDRFDRNIAYVARTQKRRNKTIRVASKGWAGRRSHTGRQRRNKTIRVASKSIRSAGLLKRIFQKGGNGFRGILAFTMEEAGYLIDQGFDDIIVAYPSVQPSDLELFTQKARQGAGLALVADSKAHVAALSGAARAAGVTLDICLDADMSFRPLGEGRGKGLHLGVRRSPLRTPEDIIELARFARDLPGVRVSSLMGYEAQVSSLNDDLPGQALKNRLVRWFKGTTVKELTQRRGEMVAALEAEGIPLEVVNGGGSGSLRSTAEDPSVTEVTAGSAFFAPGLFHHFHQVAFQPSAFFALQITRIPAPGIVTCQGGGYTASGEINRNRLPWPVLPKGLTYIDMEGAGEVQTPLVLPKTCPGLDINDPVFFQHAKAGELCERFNRLYLVKGDEIVDEVTTYRGDGHAFL